MPITTFSGPIRASRKRSDSTSCGRPEAAGVLVGTARYLVAHAPTVRATGQTYDIAARLHRGESPHELA